MGQSAACFQNEQTIVTELDPDRVTTEIINSLDFNRNSTYKQVEDMTSEITSSKNRRITNFLILTENLQEDFQITLSRAIGGQQEEVIEQIQSLQTKQEKRDLLENLRWIDFQLMDSFYYHFILDSTSGDDDVYNKFEGAVELNDLSNEQYSQYYTEGLQMIENQEVAIVILAGGMNTRFSQIQLQSLCETGLPSHKSLYQIIAERILQINHLASDGKKNNLVKIFNIVNEKNNQEIFSHWQIKNCFGLDTKSIKFVQQGNNAVLNTTGKLIFQNQVKIKTAPNGSGDIWNMLIKNEIYDQRLPKIISEYDQLFFNQSNSEIKFQYVHLIGLDNLLAKPLDPVALGYLKLNQLDIVGKVVTKSPQDEDIFSRILMKNQKLTVIEPNEILNADIRKPLFESDTLLNDIVIDLSFISSIQRNAQAKHNFAKIHHAIRRKLKYYDLQEKQVLNPINQNSYIFEKHIGDILSLSNNFKVLKVQRSQQFAPVIQQKGYFSFQDSGRMLSQLHKKWLGLNDSDGENVNNVCEISPMASYSGQGLETYEESYKLTIPKFPIIIDASKPSFSTQLSPPKVDKDAEQQNIPYKQADKLTQKEDVK